MYGSSSAQLGFLLSTTRCRADQCMCLCMVRCAVLRGHSSAVAELQVQLEGGVLVAGRECTAGHLYSLLKLLLVVVSSLLQWQLF
jgi:hypothetical protein